ncbi:MAG: AAA family ATPase [Thermoguttaceae bacterium]|nr:AAA family ATPase [Thermoguttaceae bacterium]
MDNSLKDIADIISVTFANHKNLFPDLSDNSLERIFKLDLANFILFCCVNESQIFPEEIQFFRENLRLNLDGDYIRQFRQSVSDNNSFKLPPTFVIAEIIRDSTHDDELLNTCCMFYKLFGQRFFQIRQFSPVTTTRFANLMAELEEYVQSSQTDEENNSPQTNHSTTTDEESEDGEESPEDSLPPRTEENLQRCMDELNNMTGLQKVKDDVQSLVNMIIVQKKREELGLKHQQPLSLHLVFTGNPGTGKTTVARLLAKIYYQLGLLSRGQLVETDRAGLVAGYIGQTAIKTQDVIKKAIGGILFIDEAYTLKQNYSNDFGQESIDTLLKAMEDNRDDLIVIVAGYPDLMHEFLNSNPGLQSRFNKHLLFDDYSPTELVDIFKSLCDSYGMVPDEEALNVLKEKLKVLYSQRDKSFGNGRLVRNIVERAYANQANRLAGILHECSPEELTQLKICDLPAQFE